MFERQEPWEPVLQMTAQVQEAVIEHLWGV
jgi:hypothetical protein